MMNIIEIIRKKRDGLELTREEIETFVSGLVRRKISDAQTGAMLMAMFLKDLSPTETLNLTKSMIEEGEIFPVGKAFSRDFLVDKHSTGGVGDKTSLILAPALAASGLKVPMMSGWSLGHTGGTLDKLLSIPGFQVSLEVDQMKKCLAEAGCFICCASETFAPADAILYKLRDSTSTVNNHGLITSSILSKKAAEGIGVLVVDVKFGRGSFFQTENEARKLAKTVVKVGEELNLIIRVVISDMNSPLGQYVGNALEVEEAVECLRGRVDNDLTELVRFLGGVILEATGLAKTLDEGKTQISNSLIDGTALDRFKRMLKAQGVEEKTAEDLCSGKFLKVFSEPENVTRLLAKKSGIVTELDALNIGKASRILSEHGRTEKDQIDRSSGIILRTSLGDLVNEGDPWILVHHSNNFIPEEVKRLLESSLRIDEDVNLYEKNFLISLYS